jgi:hypothetical protein
MKAEQIAAEELHLLGGEIEGWFEGWSRKSWAESMLLCWMLDPHVSVFEDLFPRGIGTREKAVVVRWLWYDDDSSPGGYV